VLGLEVVLPDGRVITTGGRARKSSAGYDLTRLFVGAEGTLGIITALTVRLHPRPEAISAAVCPFQSLQDAVQTVIRTIRAAIAVARIELLDEAMIDAVNRYSGFEYPKSPTLFFEFHGSARAVEEQTQAVQTIAAGFGAEGFRWAVEDGQRERLWKARHDAYYAARALRPDATALSTDVCVPISSLAECILKTKRDLESSPVPAPLVGHVGDGNFHLIFLLEPGNRRELDAVQELHRRLVDRALAMGGTCTGEHGVGLGKIAALAAEHGEAVETMRAIKRALDPENLLNPGKIFEA